AFSSGSPARFHQLGKSPSAGRCKRSLFCALRGFLCSSCFPSCRPASFHQLRKLPPAGRCKLTFSLSWSLSRPCSSCTSRPCPTGSGSCRKLRSCRGGEVASSGVGGGGRPLRCPSQKRGKASLQAIDLLAN